MEGLDELIEQLMHFVRGIWKFRWVGIVVAWFLLFGGILYVDQLQNRYKAETKVYIDTTSVLRPLLRGIAVESDIDAAVRLMGRELLSRPNLERAIRQLDMDLEVKTPLQMEDLITSLRQRVKIQVPRNSNVYSISFTDGNRDRARDLVQILLDIFVEDTLGKTGTESDSAIEFLENQIGKYDVLLREAEKRREEFKRENIGLMPQDGANYFSQLQRGKNELENAGLLLSEATNRRDQIRQQIDDLVANQQKVEVFHPKSALELRIEEQEQRLDELLLLYTDQHPDVLNATSVLESLRQRKIVEDEQRPSANTGPFIAENPVYQELQIRLAGTEADISSLNTRVQSLRRKQAELQKLVDIVPQIEAEMQRLNRDYEIQRDQYNQLVSRREQAKISEDVGAGGDQVKFRIIEPPFVPSKPTFPNRPLFDAAVLVASLGAGYGFSLLIALLQPVFYNQRDIRNSLNYPILGSVPKFDTPGVLTKRYANLTMFIFANLLLVATTAVLIYLHMNDRELLDMARNLVF